MFDTPEDEAPEYTIDEPIDLRPDLSALGIEEVDKGVCQDTFENRAILRRARMSWDPVYSTNGVPTGLINARSKETVMERRLMSLSEKRPLLVDPGNNNSDYLTGSTCRRSNGLLGATLGDAQYPPLFKRARSRRPAFRKAQAIMPTPPVPPHQG
jgi:hypothetical protein